MRTHFFLGLVLIFSFGSLWAQTATDLVAVNAKLKGGTLQLMEESVKLITDRALYDNQPYFINDKQLAFSAADEKGNHDIIIYSFSSGKFVNLTQTRDFNEFSPKTTDCGLYVSSITVEPTGKQRLWLYPNNFGEPELLYDDIEPVGYYAWYDNKAALFVLGSPNKLVYPYSREEVHTIASNVGRSIHRKPKTAIISYIDKSDVQDTPQGKSYAIKGFDIDKRSYHDFGRTIPGAEDMLWIGKDLILMGSGNELYIRKASQQTWKLSGQINLPSHSTLTRLAYSEKLKKLVVVMDRK
ncbi:hypothetical protein [Mongoliitalea daihaiensis]|uniref:hypothetical protein n=1 Tax=Mongoliitalea daihaiensis TaxID=2782006 RepID=UPI001F312C37|nr:hypothetical protein [Mongoliitalea daihaiensis]UJP64194.1 hypothetical protein IPZ59_15460 [Mongoliitalea daihaiensis]